MTSPTVRRRIFVTGATGFLGRHVVAEAVARGHHVVALVRPSSSTAPLAAAIETGRVTLVVGDLGSPDLATHLEGCDVLVHLAAVKGGDFLARFAGTVIGTEQVLAAATDAGVTHLVAMSTFSVYDYGARPAGSRFDESFPVIADPVGRDEYAETKLYQDELYAEFGSTTGNHMVVLRPGMIYGRDQLWHPLLGGELGPIELRVGFTGRPPITYVENTADAVVAAAERLVDPTTGSELDGEVINIVDDDLPTQRDYASQVAAVSTVPRAIPVPRPAMRALASMAAMINQRAFDGRAKLPSIMLPDQVDARFKPFDYDNSKAKRRLGWSPRFTLSEAIARSVAEVDLVADRLATADNGDRAR